MKYSSRMKYELGGLLIALGIIIFMIVGWFINLLSVINSELPILNAQLIVQIIGIVVPPLGTFMGYYSLL